MNIKEYICIRSSKHPHRQKIWISVLSDNENHYEIHLDAKIPKDHSVTVDLNMHSISKSETSEENLFIQPIKLDHITELSLKLLSVNENGFVILKEIHSCHIYYMKSEYRAWQTNEIKHFNLKESRLQVYHTSHWYLFYELERWIVPDARIITL